MGRGASGYPATGTREVFHRTRVRGRTGPRVSRGFPSDLPPVEAAANIDGFPFAVCQSKVEAPRRLPSGLGPGLKIEFALGIRSCCVCRPCAELKGGRPLGSTACDSCDGMVRGVIPRHEIRGLTWGRVRVGVWSMSWGGGSRFVVFGKPWCQRPPGHGWM